MKKYLSLIKFAHTIFALPFALIGYIMGSVVAGFEWGVLLKVVGCMILARSSAMAFNRLVDRRFDGHNPRTMGREIPSGKISVEAAWWFVAICSVGFVVLAASINMLCFLLSPVALIVILGYSYTKRFTSFCHLVLGLGLAIAPTAAYIAATGEFAMSTLLLSGLVLSWVAGFDIIFALQDVEFDRSEKLFSIPATIGIRNGLWMSAALHVITCVIVILIGCFAINTLLYWIGATLFSSMLLYQHLIVKPNDLSRVGLAFGTTNGIASVAYALFTSLALLTAPTL